MSGGRVHSARMDVGLVCDQCSTFNPIGVYECQRCGAQISLDSDGPPSGQVADSPISLGRAETPLADEQGPLSPTTSSPDASPPGEESHNPAALGTLAKHGERGLPPPPPEEQPASDSGQPRARQTRRTQFFGAMQALRAKLVLIKGDGVDGISYTLASDEHRLGRTADNAIHFEEDPFLSPIHANFLYRRGMLVVRDEQSTNGLYVRIRGTIPIRMGDRFLIGEQVLEVQDTPDSQIPKPMPDGTYFFGSPRRPAYFRVTQMLHGGASGLAFRAHRPTIMIGREGNDIDFPEDPFISGRHARLSWQNRQLTLTDLDSKNGTFLRISGEQELKHGDYVFMGQQLLRVEIV